MIIHPLDLDSKLRAPPRSFDWAFFASIALIVMGFSFFGSRFVVSPAIVIDGGFKQPVRAASQVSYVAGSVVISVKANGQIFTDTGLVNDSQLKAWLAEKIKGAPDASLLIRQDERVDTGKLLGIQDIAKQAGFKSISILVDLASATPAR